MHSFLREVGTQGQTLMGVLLNGISLLFEQGGGVTMFRIEQRGEYWLIEIKTERTQFSGLFLVAEISDHDFEQLPLKFSKTE